MARTPALRLLVLMLPLVLAVGPSAAGPRPLEPARTSVFVRLAGPSVADRLAGPGRLASGGPAVPSGLPDPTIAALRAVDESLSRSQAASVAAVERAGARVVSRYTAAANGLLVHATAEQVARLGRLPGVVGVEPAPRVRPALRYSAPYIGAPQLGQRLGYHGEGTVIAVADTGIDYTHAAFGGPGVAAAYVVASARAEVVDDQWQGQPLFPTAKVVGGWDFVGPNYSSPTGCSPALEAAGRCTTVPHPDPDPLDQHGHGTHVAGIAAGLGTDDRAIAPGVAPGASLVALKIYGPPQPGVYVDETTDVVVDAIEWCTRVNLGLPVPGTAPPRVDVVNLSLGEDWGQGSRLFDDAVAAAARAGVVVVAAAGNSGDRPYILNAPGASPQVLAVANVAPPAGVLTATARWEHGGTSFQAVEARFTPVLQLVGRLDTRLAALGDGCGGAAPPAEVRGAVALVAAGSCPDEAKIVAAEAAGAVAALVVSDGAPRPLMGTTPVTIPAFSIASDAGDQLRGALDQGQSVRVVLDPARDVAAGGMNTSSGRGPGRTGALKPDFAAPGAGILSATMGTGAGGSALSGTSMATPHAAGAVALLAQRARRESLGLRALDLAALLMNYASPTATVGGAVAPVVRQGAGRVDVLAAGTAPLVVRAGDVASVQLGLVASRQPLRSWVPLTVRNLGREPARLRPVARFRLAEDQDAGVALSVPDVPVMIPPRGSATTWLALDVDPARLRPWLPRGRQSVGAGELGLLEVDGDVTLQPVDEAGTPIADALAPHVPFYVLPRAAASTWVTGFRPANEAVTGAITLTNPVAQPGGTAVLGRVELFPLPPGGADADPDDASGELDVWRAAARFEPATEAGEGHLSFGVVLRRLAVLPQLTRLEVYVDVDGDQVSDWRLRSAAEAEVVQGGQSERMVVTATRWDARAGTPLGAERVIGDLEAEVHARFQRLTVPLSALGLARPVPLAFYVVHRGVSEDWPALTTDVVPDGADVSGGPRLTLDPDRPGGWPERSTMTLRADQAAEVTLAAGVAGAPGLLAVYLDNPLALAEQAQVIPAAGPIGSPPWATRPVFLPLARR